MRRPRINQARAFAALVAKLEPILRDAFLASVNALRGGVDFAAVVAALEARDIEGAIDAMNIERDAFFAYGEAKRSAYAESGSLAAQHIVDVGASPIGIRFGMANPGAEAWIAENVGQRITNVIADQVQAVRTAIGAGFTRGEGPLTIATDIAGRVIGGRRQGGLLGLDGPRATRLDAIIQGMKTPEGVQSLVVRHLNGSLSVRYQVNPQTAQRILSAYRRGEAVPIKAQEISTYQYRNALLKSRAETIARTETAQSVMSARHEAWTQVMSRRNLPPEAIIKTWVHGGGVKEPRLHHVAMAGTSVRGLESPFIFSNGATLRYAHDPEGDPAEILNCGCNTSFFVDPQWQVD